MQILQCLFLPYFSINKRYCLDGFIFICYKAARIVTFTVIIVLVKSNLVLISSSVAVCISVHVCYLKFHWFINEQSNFKVINDIISYLTENTHTYTHIYVHVRIALTSRKS